ncbi:enoyl-CoA hydratase/isomerase family protein [Nocardioides limicola]|uniref:enoyl-CoA hydratase/isomerase family protein n=1 Tax=Nocardioides limicola TaxID=2803368 RepID=UPI00193C5D66|nr:enoyl-CoA hydratase/isomerase family protein [Nocardioides sp. DJM-14]
MSNERLAEAGISVDIDGVVATLTLDRPEVRNAQHPRMWAAMADVLESLDASVRIVVVRGAGGTFSAGLDLALLDPAKRAEEGSLVATLSKSDQEIIDTIGEYQRPFALLSDPRFISIAVVEGHAIGAGFQLALCCDLRIVAEDARLCMKEPALGLVPDLVGTKPLVEAVGYARALEICATARFVTGVEAGELGIAQTVVPAADLEAALTASIGALTAHSQGAVQGTKALLQQAPLRTLDEQRLAERTAQVARFRELAVAFGLA